MESLTESRIDVQAFQQTQLMCPLTLEPIADPVMTPEGTVYERTAITEHLLTNFECPVTKNSLQES